jgi:hypothetical protein
MKIPDMGLISVDPKTLLNYIYKGGWVYEKSQALVSEFSIYNGRRDGENDAQFVESDLISSLLVYDFITVDSGNWDFHETYYVFNTDYDKKNNIDLLSSLNKIINNKGYKIKYNHLIRPLKLERIINERRFDK